ncbi:hypothetical protein [uncultured Nitrospira sp.]|uniref:hypothetical protein n=1 Tax=uncultured Nitrospira sp. TaxID=157176 RepID=UPI0031404A68
MNSSRDFSLSYCSHIPAGALIGWVWSVLTDYPFGVNLLGCRLRTVRALAGAYKKIDTFFGQIRLELIFISQGLSPIFQA